MATAVNGYYNNGEYRSGVFSEGGVWDGIVFKGQELSFSGKAVDADTLEAVSGLNVKMRISTWVDQTLTALTTGAIVKSSATGTFTVKVSTAGIDQNLNAGQFILEVLMDTDSAGPGNYVFAYNAQEGFANEWFELKATPDDYHTMMEQDLTDLVNPELQDADKDYNYGDTYRAGVYVDSRTTPSHLKIYKVNGVAPTATLQRLKTITPVALGIDAYEFSTVITTGFPAGNYYAVYTYTYESITESGPVFLKENERSYRFTIN